MNKLITGQISVFVLIATLVVSSFLFLSFLKGASAIEFPITICHHTPSNDVEHTFQNQQSYDGHLGTPHSGSTYDTVGPCGASTPTPVSTGTPAPTGSPVPTETPCVGRECPTPTPTTEPTPTVEPTTTPEETSTPLSCSRDTHPDAAGKNCVSFELGGPSSSGGGTGGQVLGTSTMAKTGTFEENLYLAIMGLGGVLTFKGLKNFQKALARA